VMRVRLQVRHMWESVRYGDVDYYEDRRVLDALIAAVPPEMLFSLSKKRIAKEAWDTITAARIGSDRAHKTTLQALRKEWENLAFKPGENVDEFALRLNTLQQKMVQFGVDTFDEERVVDPREVQADRSLDRVSAGLLHDVDRRRDRSPQGRRWRRTTASLGAYHRWRKVTSHSGTVGGLPG
jgi:hypothetical protein